MNYCRLCGGTVRLKMALNPTPIANSFPDEPHFGELYPLDLKQCDVCQHVQIGHVLPDDVLYGASYKYETPSAQIPELEERAISLRTRYPKAKRVLEIGANNGLFVQQLNRWFEAIGIDPSSRSSLVIPTAFDAVAAGSLGKFDLILANNVLAHIDDLNDVFVGIDHCLSENGHLVFEVQYFMDMAEKGLFDMIYHEHRDYHTLVPMVGFLAKHHLAIKLVERMPNHGGSIRVHCGRGAGIAVVEKTIDWDAFHYKVAKATAECLFQVKNARSQIIAFGATAKACTLIHQFGIEDIIAYCVDCTPGKIGKYIAGTRIRIIDEGVLLQSKSDKTLLLTAWNYESIIRAKYPGFDFIVPFKQSQKLAA